jgi:hypothetical protein
MMEDGEGGKRKGAGEKKPCTHDHIRHETKGRTVCKDCGMTMSRHRGDWVGKDDKA